MRHFVLALGMLLVFGGLAQAQEVSSINDVLVGAETDMTSVKAWILTYGAPLIIAISVLFFGLRKAGKLFGR